MIGLKKQRAARTQGLNNPTVPVVCGTLSMSRVPVVRAERATSPTVPFARKAQSVPTVPVVREERFLGRQDLSAVR